MKLRFILLFCLFSSLGFAQVSISATLDSTNIVLGDPLRYYVTLQMPKGTLFNTPKLPPESSIELLKPIESDTTEKEGDWLISQIWTITAYDSGVFTLPRMPYPYRLSNGAADTLFTPAKKIFCNTLPTDKELLPNIGIMEEPIHFRDLLPYLLAISLLVGFVYGAWRWWRKRKAAQTAAELLISTRKIPPHELAFQKLKALTAKKYPSNLEFKLYYTELTYILREYIEARYGIAALESTSEELLNDLQKIEIERSMKMSLNEVLKTADAIKFAKGSANSTEMDRHLGIVERFIQQTIPVSDKTPENLPL